MKASFMLCTSGQPSTLRRNRLRQLAVVALLGLACAHGPPRFRSQAEKHRFLESYLEQLNPQPGTRVVLASLRGEVDGLFSYLLVVGDEAIQNLTRGRPKRLKLPERGLAEILARYDASRVASLGPPAEEGGIFIDGWTWEVEVRVGPETARFAYDCLRKCVPLTGASPATDLIRLLSGYVEDDHPRDNPMPDLSADPT
ncbi:MAG: hypothetical protein QM704_08935 [Anaeromyxobacteraceae bacterium]